MTNILEAGIKERLNSPSEIKTYDVLVDLVDDSKKKDLINPFEEHSYTGRLLVLSARTMPLD